jgi:hypothetical protein
MGCSASTIDDSIDHLTHRAKYLHRETVTDGPYTPLYIRILGRWVRWRLKRLHAEKEKQIGAREVPVVPEPADPEPLALEPAAPAAPVPAEAGTYLRENVLRNKKNTQRERKIKELTDKLLMLGAHRQRQWPRPHWFTTWRIRRLWRELIALGDK